MTNDFDKFDLGDYNHDGKVDVQDYHLWNDINEDDTGNNTTYHTEIFSGNWKVWLVGVAVYYVIRIIIAMFE